MLADDVQARYQLASLRLEEQLGRARSVRGRLLPLLPSASMHACELGV